MDLRSFENSCSKVMILRGMAIGFVGYRDFVHIERGVAVRKGQTLVLMPRVLGNSDSSDHFLSLHTDSLATPEPPLHRPLPHLPIQHHVSLRGSPFPSS